MSVGHSHGAHVAAVLAAVDRPEPVDRSAQGRLPASSLSTHDGDFLDAGVLLRADPDAGGVLSDADVAHIRALAEGVAVHRLHGVGHGLQLQDPAQVADALRTSIA